jgi:amino acid transporter
MSEKKYEVTEGSGNAKNIDYGVGNVHQTSRRKSSAVNPEILAAEIFDERYETTQRGLKSRYAPSIFRHGR